MSRARALSRWCSTARCACQGSTSQFGPFRALAPRMGSPEPRPNVGWVSVVDFERIGANGDLHVLQAGVEDVAQAVAQKVETHDHDHDGEAWKDGHPGCQLHVRARCVEHPAPGGLRGLSAQAEEAECGLAKDGCREVDR